MTLIIRVISCLISASNSSRINASVETEVQWIKTASGLEIVVLIRVSINFLIDRMAGWVRTNLRIPSLERRWNDDDFSLCCKNDHSSVNKQPERKRQGRSCLWGSRSWWLHLWQADVLRALVKNVQRQREAEGGTTWYDALQPCCPFD